MPRKAHEKRADGFVVVKDFGNLFLDICPHRRCFAFVAEPRQRVVPFSLHTRLWHNPQEGIKGKAQHGHTRQGHWRMRRGGITRHHGGLCAKARTGAQALSSDLYGVKFDQYNLEEERL